MKISIAMATYNGAAYLREQLDSIAGQKRLPDELVVTDDQSTDDSARIVSEFAAETRFSVRLEINPHRLGVTRNFERALSMCSGDLVFLSDQDDVWLPEKIDRLTQYAERAPHASCIINDAWLADEALQPTGATKMAQIEALGLPKEAMVQGCCVALRGELLGCLLPIPDDQQSHDNWLVQMADLLGQTVRLREPLQYYRRHGRNASNTTANRLNSPGPWRQLRERVAEFLRRARAADGLDKEFRFCASALQRLNERQSDLLAAVGDQALKDARARAHLKWVLLSRRKDIHGMSRPSRLPHVWKLWRDGGYQQNGKLASAAKDLLVSSNDKRDGP